MMETRPFQRGLPFLGGHPTRYVTVHWTEPWSSVFLGQVCYPTRSQRHLPGTFTHIVENKYDTVHCDCLDGSLQQLVEHCHVQQMDGEEVAIEHSAQDGGEEQNL